MCAVDVIPSIGIPKSLSHCQQPYLDSRLPHVHAVFPSWTPSLCPHDDPASAVSHLRIGLTEQLTRLSMARAPMLPGDRVVQDSRHQFARPTTRPGMHSRVV